MIKIPFVDLKAQYDSIAGEIDAAIRNVISESSFIKGKYVDDFEKHFARILGMDHSVGVGNATDGLYICLKALGVDKGDEVITAANTFIATSEAISMTGAKPVFVDCEPVYYTIHPELIKSKISKKTRAIIPVHLYGHPAEMAPILNIADHYNIPVIEDVAQAHLARYKMPENDWKFCGTMGQMSVFSFFPSKNLGAYGDAGLIVTNNPELDRFIRMYGNHGRKDKYTHEFEGFNSRLDGIQAAILDVKLKYLELWTEKRRQAAERYTSLLKGIPGIICPSEKENSKHVYHLFVIRTEKRDELQDYLTSCGISTGIHYPDILPDLPPYKQSISDPDEFPVASSYAREILSIPIYPEITFEQQEYVAGKIKEFYS
jgi:dTDP-4-amino-4,6-dideoxygalactose transaminase